MKILIGINTLTSVSNNIYGNHIQVISNLRHKLPDWQFALFTPHRMSIDRMRNEAAKVALENDFDYLLFIDDDVLVPLDGVQKLLDSGYDVIAGWTIIRGYPFENMFFKWTDEKKNALKKVTDEEIKETQKTEYKGIITSIMPCNAVGFSLCLIKVSLLRNIPKPYFVTGPFNTEDVFFCIRAQEFVQDVSIGVHLDVKTGHLLDPEPVTPENVAQMRKAYEILYPELLDKQEEPIDRGDAYLKQIGISV